MKLYQVRFVLDGGPTDLQVSLADEGVEQVCAVFRNATQTGVHGVITIPTANQTVHLSTAHISMVMVES